MLLKKIFVGCLFLLSGCGFSPLYMVDKNTGQLETEKIEVAPIQDYNGYVLKQGLDNAFNPKKVHGPKKYILKVQMKNPHLSSQSIQGDNFASRKKVSLRASFQLIDKETKKELLSSSTTALGAFNVFYEPYTTYQAEKRQIEDLVQILVTNISTRVAAYFKQEEVFDEGQTLTD
ncbi:MAG: hypothetical protein IKL90_05015 [Alphaproteobacteria bacterium]|nr:hypothetical protein [Alphaproteobacteria bacterium]